MDTQELAEENINDSELIEHIRRFEVIYSKTHPFYKYKGAKENAWTTISVILDREIASCESRWTVLRNRFNTERRLLNSLPSGSAPMKVWPLYNQLSFLNDHCRPRRTRSNTSTCTVQNSGKLSSGWDSISQMKEATDDSPSKSCSSVTDNVDNDDSNETPLENEPHSKRSAPESDSPNCPTPKRVCKENATVTRPALQIVALNKSINAHPELVGQLRNKTPKLKRKKEQDTVVKTINEAWSNFNNYLNKKESGEPKSMSENADLSFGKTIGYDLTLITDNICKQETKKQLRAIMDKALDLQNVTEIEFN